MTPLRCLIVDDEPLAHKVLENYIQQLDFLELAGHCYSGPEAISFLSSKPAEVVFLDVEMPGMSGTTLLRALSHRPAVIMTTAYRDYAAESYDYEVTDYLLKPFPFERFVRAVQKVQKQLQASVKTTVANPAPAAVPVAAAEAEAPVFIRSGSEVIRVQPGELLYIEGLKEYLKLHRTTGTVVIKASFKEAEALFRDGELLRIHKSYLVAVRHIEHIRGSEVKVGKQWLPVGRSYKALVQQFLDASLPAT